MARFGEFKAQFFARSNLNTPLSDGTVNYRVPVDGETSAVRNGTGRTSLTFGYDSLIEFLIAEGNVCICYQYDSLIADPYIGGTPFCLPFEIESVTPAGPGLIRIEGPDLLDWLLDVQHFSPIGGGTETNTTVAVAVSDPASTTLAAGAPHNNDSLLLASTTGWQVGDEARVTLDGGGVHVTAVRSVNPDGAPANTIQIVDRLPGDAAGGNTVTRRRRRVQVAAGQGAAFQAGVECRLTLDDNSVHTTLIAEEPDGDLITMRDGAPDGAAVGKTIKATDYSQPTTSDVTKIMSYMAGWTTEFDGAYTGTAEGTHHAPHGDSVYDLLVATAKATGEFFRLKSAGPAAAPSRTVQWKRSGDYAGQGGNLRLVQPAQASIDSDAANVNRGIITGDVERAGLFQVVTRIVPLAGDNRITLALCSEEARLLAMVEGFTVVDSGLGLYTPPYLYNAAAEAELGMIARTVTFSQVRVETDNATEWISAADQLMRLAIAYLYERGSDVRYRYTVPDIVTAVPVAPGQRVEMVYTSPDGRWSVNATAANALYVLEVRARFGPPEEDAAGNLNDRGKLVTLVLADSIWDIPDAATATAAAIADVGRVARVAARSGGATATIIMSSEGGGGDHGGLTGLADDDHPQYLRADGTRALAGNLAVNSGVTVDGVDISVHASNSGAHHAPVTVTNTSLNLAGQAMSVALASGGGLSAVAGGLTILVDSDGGLELASGYLQVKLPTNSGLASTSSGLSLGSPGTLTATTNNSISGAVHHHNITVVGDTSSGTADTILASNSEGGLGLARLGVGIAPNTAAALYARAKATDDYTLWLKQLTGQTADIWRVEDVAGNALIRLTGGGDLESGYPGFVSRVTGWQIEHGGNAEFNNVFIRGELHATTFVADEMHATGGTVAVMTATKLSVGINANDNILPAIGNTFTLNSQASWDTGLCYFAVNDVIRCKPMGEIASGGSLDLYDIYMQVTATGSITGRNLANGNAGYFPMTVRRLHGGETGFEIPAGSALVKWGKIGSTGYTGGMILSSDLQYSPYLDIFTIDATKTAANWQTAPITPIPRVRVGNLRGVLGKSADEWGMAAGTNLSDTTTAARYIVASDVAGVRLQNLDIDIYSGADRVLGLERVNGLELLISTTHQRARAVTWENSSGNPVASISADITSGVVHFELGVDPAYGTANGHVTGLDIYTDASVSWVNVTADNLITDGAFYAGGGVALTGAIYARGASDLFDHGMSAAAPSTDTYAYLLPVAEDTGGALLRGLGESAVGLQLEGIATTTTAGTGTAPVVVNGRIKSGTNGAAVGSGNLVVFNNNGASRVIFKYNGDIYSDSSTSITLFDAYDDPALLRALSYELNPAGVIRDEWDAFVNYNRGDLEKAGIIEGTMVNQTALGRLLTGAVWQLARRVAALEAQ